MYDVFDCTRAVGVTCGVPGRLVAHLVAVVLTKITGRFHDYESAGVDPWEADA